MKKKNFILEKNFIRVVEMNREYLVIETEEKLDLKTGYVNRKDIVLTNINENLRYLAKGALRRYASFSYEEELFDYFRENLIILYLIYADFVRISKYKNNEDSLDVVNQIKNKDDLMCFLNDVNIANRKLLINMISSSIEFSQLNDLCRAQMLMYDLPLWLKDECLFDEVEKKIYRNEPDLADVINNILMLKESVESFEEFDVDKNPDEKNIEIFNEESILKIELNIEQKELEIDLLILFETNKSSYYKLMKEIFYAYIIKKIYQDKTLNNSSEVIEKLEKLDVTSTLTNLAFEKNCDRFSELVKSFIDFHTEILADDVENVVTKGEFERVKKKLDIK